MFCASLIPMILSCRAASAPRLLFAPERQMKQHFSNKRATTMHGNIDALPKMGVIYSIGRGVLANDGVAALLMGKAAELRNIFDRIR